VRAKDSFQHCQEFQVPEKPLASSWGYLPHDGGLGELGGELPVTQGFPKYNQDYKREKLLVRPAVCWPVYLAY
jgi:hypothetical protein